MRRELCLPAKYQSHLKSQSENSRVSNEHGEDAIQSVGGVCQHHMHTVSPRALIATPGHSLESSADEPKALQAREAAGLSNGGKVESSGSALVSISPLLLGALLNKNPPRNYLFNTRSQRRLWEALQVRTFMTVRGHHQHRRLASSSLSSQVTWEIVCQRSRRSVFKTIEGNRGGPRRRPTMSADEQYPIPVSPLEPGQNEVTTERPPAHPDAQAK